MTLIIVIYLKMRGGYQIRGSGIYFVTFTVVKWVDIFTKRSYCDVIVESLKYCQKKKGLNIHAYVIMSNHIHLILSSDKVLSDIIRDLKKFTSRKILKMVINEQESRREWMLNIFRFEAKKNKRNTQFQLWQHDNHPIDLDSNFIMDQKLDYLHDNPVKAGLVYTPEDYIYSSASAYSGRESMLEISFLE